MLCDDKRNFRCDSEPPSHCDLVFRLFRSHCISFHASVFARVTALPWLRLWQSNALDAESSWRVNLFECRLARLRLTPIRTVVVDSDSGASH